jgi:hypothetical protein
VSSSSSSSAAAAAASTSGAASSSAAGVAAAAYATSLAAALPQFEPGHDVYTTVEERLALVLDREGAVTRLEVKGELRVVCMNPGHAAVAIFTNGPPDKADSFQFRLPPKVDRQRWTDEGVIAFKETNRGFPTGFENAVAVLKWRTLSTSEDQVPISINFWPNTEEGRIVVSVEVQHVKSGVRVHDVVITIPCPSNEAPEVTTCEGDYTHHPRAHALTWRIAELGDNESSATLEFSIPEVDAEALYPINVAFNSSDTYANLRVTDVRDAEGAKAPVDHVGITTLITEKYVVE